MSSTLSILSAILFVCLTGIHSQKCLINLEHDLNRKNPPMVVSLSSGPHYVYPSPDDPTEIVVKSKQTLTIACPKKTDRASSKTIGDGALQLLEKDLKPNRGYDEVTCLGDDFNLDENEVNFANISCGEKQRASYSPILREAEGSCLLGKRYEIGYDLGEGQFLRTLELCHDSNEDRTLWAHDVIQPVNTKNNRFKTGSRKSFKTGILYSDISMTKDMPYNVEHAFKTLAKILNSEEKAKKYLSPVLSDRKFFAKGHLIADADKIYKSEKDSTYFYANTVPMWQQINAQPGNWFFVEEYVRKLAVSRGSVLDVWVGGLGVAELEGHKIYLVPDKSKIPVPNVLFKCAVDRATEEAICFLVVNNPYVSKAEIEKPKNDYIACTKKSDVCDGLTSHQDDVELGYLYCCDLKDFVQKSKKELGLEDLQEFIDYKTMSLASS